MKSVSIHCLLVNFHNTKPFLGYFVNLVFSHWVNQSAYQENEYDSRDLVDERLVVNESVDVEMDDAQEHWTTKCVDDDPKEWKHEK